MRIYGQLQLKREPSFFRILPCFQLGIFSLLIVCCLVLSAVIPAVSQVDSPIIDISIRIIRPISIRPTSDLQFGEIFPANGASEVTISPNSTVASSGLATFLGPFQSATFIISGEPGFGFTVTIPSEPLDIFSGINKMTVTGWTKNLPDRSILPDGGSVTLNVGATLAVDAVQPPGTYMGAFQVSVAYE